MQTYIQHLNFNFNPLIENIECCGSWTKTTHLAVSRNKLNPELIILFKKYNLFPGIIEIFYTPAGGQRYIHVDEYPGGDYVKLNWQTGGLGSQMRWYTINKNDTVKQPLTTVINTKFLRFEPNEVTLAHEDRVGYPSIVQVGVPHDIINNHESRYVLSVVPRHLKTGKRVTMTEALTIFKKFLITN